MLSVVISGCGYSGDHALDNHQQESVTEVKLDVVQGSVYAPTDRPITLSFNSHTIPVLTESQRSHFEILEDYAFALHQPGFFDDDGNFFFQNVPAEAILSAKFPDYTLYSFYSGIPIPKTDVTVTQDHNWHGSDRLTLSVSKKSPYASVSINPFSNLAYWLGGGANGSYATYTKARAKIDNDLGFAPALPACLFEANLCKDHLDFLAAGNTIDADSTGFRIRLIKRGNALCTGDFKNYTGTMKLCPES
jgi:hypothetical protein